MTLAPWPDHLMTLEEWDALPPDGAHRYELVEGVLLVVPRPAAWHQRATLRLGTELDNQLPDDLTALADYEVVVESVSLTTVRAPDVVVTYDTVVERNLPRINASDVLVAVEIVSPGTGRTDRVMKPVEYADAGIPHYWLVEMDPISITAYTLVDGDYEIVAQSSEILSVLEPVPMTIDVRKLIKRR